METAPIELVEELKFIAEGALLMTAAERIESLYVAVRRGLPMARYGLISMAVVAPDEMISFLSLMGERTSFAA